MNKLLIKTNSESQTMEFAEKFAKVRMYGHLVKVKVQDRTAAGRGCMYWPGGGSAGAAIAQA